MQNDAEMAQILKKIGLSYSAISLLGKYLERKAHVYNSIIHNNQHVKLANPNVP